MTAPLFLVEPGRLAGLDAGATVVVDGAEGRHAAAVMRLAVGQAVLVADGAGTLAHTEVTGVERAALHTRILEVAHEPVPDPALVLVQALAKGDRDEQAIETATELGVDVVVPWQASRSVVRWRADRVERGIRRWEGVLVAATKQCRRSRIPQLHPPASTGEVARLLEQAAVGLVLDEGASDPLAGSVLPAAGTIVVVVGPEGGIAPEELATFAAAGARAVRLGREVLRASSAGPAALAVLNAAGRWR